jgi:nitrous oxidase accessory protein NosD
MSTVIATAVASTLPVIADTFIPGFRPRLAPPLPRVIGPTKVSVITTGADPKGVVDATAAFQKAIDSLPAAGGEVSAPAGIFLIDPTVGIQFRNHMRLRLDPRTIIRLKTNDQARYGCLAIKNVTDVEVVGGKIMGDRDTHIFAVQKIASQNTHEWGHAIQVYGSSRVTIKSIVLRDCTGDGISMSDQGLVRVDDVMVLNTVSTRNRRQGISVGKATNVRIVGGEISYINGTAPECGIDIEPENGGQAKNIYIDRVHIHHNHANAIIGLQRSNVDSPVGQVSITNCILENNRACGIYGIAIAGFNIEDNIIRGNGQSGIHLSAGCTSVFIEGNTFAQNYHHAARTTPATVFGYDPKYIMDIDPANTLTENNIGRNFFQ